MGVYRLYTGDDGQSHIEELDLDRPRRHYSGPGRNHHHLHRAGLGQLH